MGRNFKTLNIVATLLDIPIEKDAHNAMTFTATTEAECPYGKLFERSTEWEKTMQKEKSPFKKSDGAYKDRYTKSKHGKFTRTRPSSETHCCMHSTCTILVMTKKCILKKMLDTAPSSCKMILPT